MKPRNIITYFPHTLEKQDSFLILHDPTDNKRKKFEPIGRLGKGHNGHVRLFAHQDETIAVKSPHSSYALADLSWEDMNYDSQNIQKEFGFLRLIYPDEIKYFLHEIPKLPSNDKESWHYDYRMIMPFIDGIGINQYVKRFVNTYQDMATLILRLAEELQRIHDAGIIHGDIAPRNIIVSGHEQDYKVYIIDYGMAYKMNGYISYFHLEKMRDRNNAPSFPRERYSEKDILAHPSQDVFSLASCINSLIDRNANGEKWAEYFKKSYPCIQHFIRMATHVLPDQRPDLAWFIRKLTIQDSWKKQLPQSIQKFIDTLEYYSFSEVRTLIDADKTAYTLIKLNQLLFDLCKNNEYALAAKLIHFKKKLSPPALTLQQLTILKLFLYIENNSQFDKELSACETNYTLKMNAAKFMARAIIDRKKINPSDEIFQKHKFHIREDAELSAIYDELHQQNIIHETGGMLNTLKKLFSH